MVGTSEMPAMSPASSASLTSAASNRGCRRIGPPNSTLRTTIDRPPTWKSGMQASHLSAMAGPRGSAAASALAAKLLQLRHAPFERPDVPDVNSTTSSASSAASSPGNGPFASGRPSNCGTATIVSPGSRSASSARRESPCSPSNRPARASVSCCASSSVVRRAFSGNAALPASERAASHPTNRASPGSSIATGAAAGGTDATMCAAPRRARPREFRESPGRVLAFDRRRVGRDSGAGEQRETEAHGVTPRPAVAVNAARPSRQSTGSATSRTKSPAVRRPCCADASPHAAAQCRA